jgi:hypothetical protein
LYAVVDGGLDLEWFHDQLQLHKKKQQQQQFIIVIHYQCRHSSITKNG